MTIYVHVDTSGLYMIDVSQVIPTMPLTMGRRYLVIYDKLLNTPLPRPAQKKYGPVEKGRGGKIKKW